MEVQIARVDAIKAILEDFIEWARKNTPDQEANRDEPHCWEVALLSLIKRSGAASETWCAR